MFFLLPVHCISLKVLSVRQFVCLSVHNSFKSNISVTDESILMNFYTNAVYNLTLCMKEDNPGLKHLKGDN